MHRDVLTIELDHPSFAGHFPGRPVIPGVLLLDAAARTIAAALAPDLDPLWSADGVKFPCPALPGDALRLEWESPAPGVASFAVARGSEVVVKGMLHFEPPSGSHA